MVFKKYVKTIYNIFKVKINITFQKIITVISFFLYPS